MLKKKYFKTKEECEVTFELISEGAGRVELLCEANDWQPVEMKKLKKGPFRTKMRFPKERDFEFVYRVDQHAWVNDDAADAHRPNGFGGQNSVLDTTPAG